MSRIHLFTDTHVWYAYLQATSKIFADERDKKIFLEYVLQSKKEKGFRVFAFSLLDDEVHILMDTEEQQAETATGILKDLFSGYRDYYLANHGKTAQGGIEGKVKCLPVCQTKELLELCKCIHQKPLKKGYVKKLDDYWWSSFLTYRGVYSWEFVDTRPVLSSLSDSEVKSRRQFRKFHQQEPG